MTKHSNMGTCCMTQGTQIGALYRPKGWDGEGDARKVQEGGKSYAYL